MAPTEQKALFLLAKGGDFSVQTTSVPTVGPGKVLARIESAALNPVDYKIKDWALPFISYPGILGTDGAGVVVEVGEGVTNLKKGDKILWQGSFTNDGATFQQYGTLRADLAAKIPNNISLDEAASLPVTLATAFLGLYQAGKDGQGGGAALAPFYTSPNAYAGQPFVLLGGATSVGQYAIQLARLSGFSPIITTASVKHADYLKSLGATHVLSRDLPADAISTEISKITSQPIKYVYDTVSLADTQKTGWSLLASGGTLIITLPVAEGIVRGQDGKSVAHVGGNVNSPGQDVLGRELYARLTQLLESGSIKPNYVQVVPNGLAGIPDGLDLLRKGKVSGTKLVAHPQETT
ncbi:GroES-like protein [Punctularia strigosozonata HHB-11173 SS5]|uniref:GroES-like protein n=1 Tax=Punctularia strigosozonata (strain HHB-11173) TaxID=741275 RepID=UPI0004416B2D|nr:GroES-like protein [Punctularia strigosozonata HHB-11173 SS5]EIN10100.1 GroES-like protein [Punctularia strigosozonata HHB-11173 SS5]